MLFGRRMLSTVLPKIKNCAIIAHVDHGKTSLVDQLLRQTGSKIEENSRVMDSNALERERGITILSKSTAINYKDHRINIVDTPGHADFGGEVERVLSMVDGVCLVVCGTEGPMTQTRFVLKKALERNLKPLVVMNKIDRPTSRPEQVENDILELFIGLDATEEQMEYPLLYASAKQGWANTEITPSNSINPLLDAIIEHVPCPKVDADAPFSLLVTQIENDPYIGKCYLGKISSGSIKIGDPLKSLDPKGNTISVGKCTKIILRHGIEQESVEEAVAGDIVTIAGIQGSHVNHTICNPNVEKPLQVNPIDEPTISMMFYVNDSPVGGKEGTQLTSQAIRDRLLRELETNVSLEVIDQNEAFQVKGRGELQMGILIETMRREGFELSVSAPRVLFKKENGKIMEPIEEVTIDVSHEYAGTVIEKMNKRKGVIKHYGDHGDGARIILEIPTRGLLGYPAEFKNDTHGQGTLNYVLSHYDSHRGPIENSRKGSLISTSSGETTAYALQSIEARGKLFVKPGEVVYPGMIIGEHTRDSELEVNPVKAKQLTNLRASGKEDAIRLTPVNEPSLEHLLSYIQDDEVIEVTPSKLRIRKKILDSAKRKQMTKKQSMLFA